MTALKFHEHFVYPAQIRLYGQRGKLGEMQEHALCLGNQMKPGVQWCSVLPPFSGQDEAWHKVVQPQPAEVMYGEAIVLNQPEQGAIFSSRDCPIVVVSDSANKKIGVAHAGWKSLMKTGGECPACDGGVLENLLGAMGAPPGESLSVYVTAGISAKYFTRKTTDLVPFMNKFGAEVVVPIDDATSGLDLLATIKAVLQRYGVKSHQIMSDRLCTVDETWLGSKRGRKEKSNWVYVTSWP